jgi:type III pantothenate kinase
MTDPTRVLPYRAGLLVLDVGNSQTAAAVVQPGDGHEASNIRYAPTDDSDALRDALAALWAQLPTDEPRRIAAASVVRPATERIRELVRDEFDAALQVVRDDLPLPIDLAVENPDQVGTDRVCAAAAAYAKLGHACVVADFGTAITIDVVSDDGLLLGGAILPGLRMAAQSLHEHTAALPLVEPVRPHGVWGRNTLEAIQVGLYCAAAGALREVVERYATEMGKWPDLIVTGGWAKDLAGYCDFIDRVVPALVLHGVALAYRLAARERDPKDLPPRDPSVSN